jgi:hypothetical protein
MRRGTIQDPRRSESRVVLDMFRRRPASTAQPKSGAAEREVRTERAAKGLKR